MHKYEFATIIECEGKTDDEIQETIGKIRELFSEYKGKIIKEDVWGKRELAYTIQKQNNGYYMFTTLMLEPASVNNLEKKMKLVSGNLRFMLINLDNEPGYKQQMLEDVAKEESEKNTPVADQKEEKTQIKSEPVAEKKKEKTGEDKKEEAKVDTAKKEVKAELEKEEKVIVKEEKPTMEKPVKKEKEVKKKDEKPSDKTGDKKEDNKDLDKLLEEIL